jgi:hypothetical protein
LLVRFDHVASFIGTAHNRPVKEWEIIADNLHDAGWSFGWVSAIDSNGRTIWIADAHGYDGHRFIVHADDKLTAFVELEVAIRVGIPLTNTLRKHRLVRAVGPSAPRGG